MVDEVAHDQDADLVGIVMPMHWQLLRYGRLACVVVAFYLSMTAYWMLKKPRKTMLSKAHEQAKSGLEDLVER